MEIVKSRQKLSDAWKQRQDLDMITANANTMQKTWTQSNRNRHFFVAGGCSDVFRPGAPFSQLSSSVKDAKAISTAWWCSSLKWSKTSQKGH